MKLSHSLLMLFTGMVFGVAFVLSCGNSSAPKADAADAGACNCPAAEPLIIGRVVEAEAMYTIPANTIQQLHGVACPPAPVLGTVLGGGCGTTSAANIILEQSYPDGNGWTCAWQNPTNADITVRAVVRCLPAPPQ